MIYVIIYILLTIGLITLFELNYDFEFLNNEKLLWWSFRTEYYDDDEIYLKIFGLMFWPLALSGCIIWELLILPYKVIRYYLKNKRK